MWTPKFWSSWRKPCRHPCMRPTRDSPQVGEEARGATRRPRGGERRREKLDGGSYLQRLRDVRERNLLSAALVLPNDVATNCCCCCWWRWCQISTGEGAHPPHTLPRFARSGSARLATAPTRECGMEKKRRRAPSRASRSQWERTERADGSLR